MKYDWDQALFNVEVFDEESGIWYTPFWFGVAKNLEEKRKERTALIERHNRVRIRASLITRSQWLFDREEEDFTLESYGFHSCCGQDFGYGHADNCTLFPSSDWEG